MDRELLLEIGCEELPASWLPGLTNQIGEVIVAAAASRRLVPEAPAETFSTPRRLTVRIARVAERQTDLEELVTGPPVSASFAADGTPTPLGVRVCREAGRRGRRPRAGRDGQGGLPRISQESSADVRRWTCCRTCSRAYCAR